MRDDRRVDSSIASRAARRIENQLWNQISGVKRIHVRTHALRQVSAQIRTGHSSRSSRGSGTYMADVARFFRNRVDRSRRDRRTRQRDPIPDEIIVRHTRAAVDHDQRARQITHSLHEEVHRPWLRSLGVRRRPCTRASDGQKQTGETRYGKEPLAAARGRCHRCSHMQPRVSDLWERE